MIKNITLGQYFPMDSPVHKLDARFKLILTFVFIVTIFFAGGIFSYTAAILLLLLIIFFSKIRISLILRSLKPLVFILLITAILNIFYTPGDALWQWWIFKISLEGLALALKMGLRIIILVAGSSILTYTTSPIMLTDAIEAVMAPLKIIRVPVHELAMMMSIALRFIPTLIEETEKIINAQKSRGADFETGNIFRRAKALIPILVPLFVSAFRRADELAMAMEARCYTGGEGRTRLKPLKAHCSDAVIFIAVSISFGSVIYLGSIGL